MLGGVLVFAAVISARISVASTPAGLKVLPVKLPIPLSSTSVVTIRDRTINPVAQLFIDCARKLTAPFAERK